jgi:hypothetical protein
LPNASSAATANANTVYTYATVPSTLTYDNAGGSYFDQEDSFSRFLMFTLVQDTGNGITASKVDVLDFADLGRLAIPIDSDVNVNPDAFVERVGYELDMEGADLRAYKQVRQFIPLAYLTNPSATLAFWGASTNEVGIHPTWGPRVNFDPRTAYKIDTTLSGRFLAFSAGVTTVNDFSFSGMDLDVIITGRR